MRQTGKTGKTDGTCVDNDGQNDRAEDEVQIIHGVEDLAVRRSIARDAIDILSGGGCVERMKGPGNTKGSGRVFVVANRIELDAVPLSSHARILMVEIAR